MSSVFCHRILEGLWAAGVRDMIVTPGSRSTPLLLAALNSKLRLHSVIDERSAAFFALGRARAQGSKVALLCTSGTAGAHYLPALIEARYAEHCVIALTADRPPELQQTGANQTIDQRMLFASACPPCVEIPVPEASERSGREAGRRVHEAAFFAKGPLHINLAFRKPLEPDPSEPTPKALEMPELEIEKKQVAPEKLEELSEACRSVSRGLIVCGPLADSQLASEVCALARAQGFPLLAEATSGARFVGQRQPERIDAFPHILSAPSIASALEPEMLLQFGAAPASGPLSRWLDGSRARRIRFTGSQNLRAQEPLELLQGDAIGACQVLANVAAPPPSEYLTAWRNAESAAWQSVEQELAREAPKLSEATAMATVLAALPSDTQLTLGNSLPVRSIDAVLPGHAARLRVLHQRGASGIEGLIAGALGSCGSTRSVLLFGDVSCAHDLASLALAPIAEGPLLIVVIDNGGGKIFSHLPVAGLNLPAKQWSFWETPPRVDFGLVCQAHGIAYRACETTRDLKDVLRWAHDLDRSCMIHIRVSPDSMRTFLSNVRGAMP